MGREKKITVKPLLNTEVKGKLKSVFDEPEFPLYIEVTYNRRYTKFPFGDFWFTAEAYPGLLETPTIKYPVFAVEKIIEYERERSDAFSIKGLSSRIKSYFSPHYDCAVILLDNKIERALRKKLTVVEFERWQKMSIVNRIKEGVEELADSNLEIGYFNLLSTLNLGLIVGANNVYSWLVLMSDKQKKKAVESALLLFKKNGLVEPFRDLSGYLEKNPSPSEVIKAIDSISNEIIDNEIVMDFDIVSLRKLKKY